jgi:hypothetical protein
MQKQGIKVSSAWQINIPTSPEELLETRICTSSTPGCPWLLHLGLKQLFKLFLAKEKLVLMKNEAILTCSAPIPGRSLFLLYN